MNRNGMTVKSVHDERIDRTGDSGVIGRLGALRAVVRRRLVLYGVCIVAAGAVGAFLAVVLLDWMLWFPPVLRILVGLIYVAGGFGAAYYWIALPVRAPLALDAIAARLERHFQSLDDRLISTVNFLQCGDAGSSSMMSRVVANTERQLAKFPLETALSLKPLATRVCMTSATLFVAAAVLYSSPDWVRTGLYRYLDPWGEIHWPRTVSLQAMTGDKVVAVGESVTVRMAVRRGLTNTLRGVVHVRDGAGRTTTLAMRQGDDGEYETTLDSVTGDLEYWFEAGDDDTKEHPYAIHAVRRPEVVEVLATVDPPDYAADRAPREHDFSTGPVRAPIGGSVRVTVRSSKPIPTIASGQGSGLRTQAGRLIPLVASHEDPLLLSASIAVSEDIYFRVELRDQMGFESRGAAQHVLLATPDKPPVVTITKPASTVEVTQSGSVHLVVRIEDDFGIESLVIESEVAGHEGGHTFSLTDKLAVKPTATGLQSTVSHSWAIESLGLAPGDLVIYRAVAIDNKETSDGIGLTGRSSAMRIQVISELEFATRIRSDLAMLESKIRDVAVAEGTLRDRTRVLIQPHGEVRNLAPAERETAAAMAATQTRLARRVDELARRFGALVDRMDAGGQVDRAMRDRIDAQRGGLMEIARRPMNRAAVALREAGAPTPAVGQQESLKEAVRLQKESGDRLDALLRSMAQLGSFQEIVSKTRDLFDRQNALRVETARVGQASLGKSVDELTESGASALRSVARRQERLGRDVGALLEQMKRLAEDESKRDASGGEAIDAALRTARTRELTKQLRRAVREIKGNKTAGAGLAQKAAADAIRGMEDALAERERRELELLSKRLAEAQEQVANLIEDQEDLRNETRDAQADANWRVLGRSQHTLRRNAELLAESLAEQEQSASAGTIVGRAAEPMGAASRHLRTTRATDAQTAQEAALALLDDAYDALADVADDVENELMRKSLARLREDMEEILAAQQAVNEDIAVVVDVVSERGRISRKEARAANKIARAQAEVAALVDDQLDGMKKAIVYRWSLEKIKKRVEDNRERLIARTIDGQLSVNGERIVRSLERLIQAIIDTQALPVDTQFVESEGGGGGSSGSKTSPKPVPSVAELLLLKSMQVEINEETVTLGDTIDLDVATEDELNSVRSLGERQAEVRRLIEQVSEIGAQP